MNLLSHPFYEHAMSILSYIADLCDLMTNRLDGFEEERYSFVVSSSMNVQL